MCAVIPRAPLRSSWQGAFGSPVASPAKGRFVRTSQVHPHRPVNRVRRFITGRVIHPAPDQKGAFPLPSGLPMDQGGSPRRSPHGPPMEQGSAPWTAPLFRQRPRPGRSLRAPSMDHPSTGGPSPWTPCRALASPLFC